MLAALLMDAVKAAKIRALKIASIEPQQSRTRPLHTP